MGGARQSMGGARQSTGEHKETHDKPCAHTKHDLSTSTWPVKPITSYVLTQNET